MKNRVEVVIAGNRFTMTGEQDEEYMTKIAALVDNRVCKVRESGANMLQAVLLTACDMADNYVQAVQGAENLRTQISGYLAENKNLSRELADAQEEINSLERAVNEKNKEMTEVNRFKDRISELEALVQANEADKVRINELEEKLSDTQKRMQSASVEADARTRRVSELEQQLAEADARHNNDLEQAERTGRELRELREKVVDGDKKQRRIEELEKELASTERQLNEVRSRLSRLLK
ncbi:MAG: cell division protein ZapA [Butyricicoccus sp.]|nr:cell division protein ZapA [Clostridiales bacterium]